MNLDGWKCIHSEGRLLLEEGTSHPGWVYKGTINAKGVWGLAAAGSLRGNMECNV